MLNMMQFFQEMIEYILTENVLEESEDLGNSTKQGS